RRRLRRDLRTRLLLERHDVGERPPGVDPDPDPHGRACGKPVRAGCASSSRWCPIRPRLRSARWSNRCGTLDPGVSEAIAVAGSSRALTHPSCEAARATTSAIGVTIIELPK